MKAIQLKWSAALLALTAVAALNQAEGATLKVGDPAPKLQVSKWVQGEPVKEFKSGTAYIVEFWATWCGPCRISIPHLNEIYMKYKDKGLIVIGQDAWERDQDAVAPFVKKMGDKMTYRVALDTVEDSEKSKGKMADTWMEAAGQNGIPTAFVVDPKGRIAWIGHPMELKESTLEQVLDGSFDLKKAAADYETKQKNQEQLTKLSRQLSQSVRAKEWAEAESTLDKMEHLLPEEQREGLSMMRFQVFIGRKDYPAAYKLAGQLSDAHKDNPMLQNQLAWNIATQQDIEERNLDLAEKIAIRANAAAKDKDASILDTLARVQFMNGKKDAAIETQQKAVNLAEGNFKDKFQATLDSYKEGKLPKAE